MDTLAMLEELLEQDQFELLIPKDGMSGELRLVYLMNDAAESFLVFKNAKMNIISHLWSIFATNLMK